ncbi:MAG TPA: hypothetical protein VHG93_05610 [Longimicrobium sp.]|nr:hypothetical protein [Longimicrobium sp.]
MMGHPRKTAFRAGYVAGGQRDESNIGYYSGTGGALTTAAGIYSLAMGNQNTVESGAQAALDRQPREMEQLHADNLALLARNAQLETRSTQAEARSAELKARIAWLEALAAAQPVP